MLKFFDVDPGWKIRIRDKDRIRDKHPGSATLEKPCCFRDKKFRWSEVDTSQLESTQPVNFSPSHRPRRQDFKVRVI